MTSSNESSWKLPPQNEELVAPAVLNIFLPFTGFLSNLLLPWKTMCPEFTVLNIYFLSFRILNNLRLPWKTEFALKFFTVGLLKYFLSFTGFLSNLRLPWKTMCPEFTVLNIYFLSFRIFNNFRLSWKTEFALNIYTALKYFLSFRIFEQLAFALKKNVPWIHCTEYIFFIIQNFEQLPLFLKNRVCPKFLHCIEIFFIIQDFWATCACPENRVCPEFFKPGGSLPPPNPHLVRHCTSAIFRPRRQLSVLWSL